MTDESKTPNVVDLSATLDGTSGVILNTVSHDVRHELDGWYRQKPLVVYAKCMSGVFFVTTQEGPLRGEPGDWLIQDPTTGYNRLVKGYYFGVLYEPAVAPSQATLAPEDIAHDKSEGSY